MKVPIYFLVFAFLAGIGATLLFQRSPLGNKTANIISEVMPAKQWNWCPEHTEKIVIRISGTEITSKAEIEGLCKVPMSRVFPVSTPGSFSALFRSQNKAGQVAFLEYDSRQKLFRIDSQVFSSETYSRLIMKYPEIKNTLVK